MSAINLAVSTEVFQVAGAADALTGLPTRALFKESVDCSIASAISSGTGVFLLRIDIDELQCIQDTYGATVGDQVIVSVASRIDRVLGGRGALGRVDHGSFAVAVSRIDHLAAAKLAQRLLAAISTPVVIDGHPIHINAVAGAARAPEDGVSPDELLRAAGLASAFARRDGWQGRPAFFAREMQSALERRHMIVAGLRDAIANDEFEVVFQPIVELASGHMVKAEALLRWRHPVLGNVSPAVFIPIAEESGLLQQIDDWVFREALVAVKSWNDRGFDMAISVNKSPKQLIVGWRLDAWLSDMRDLGVSADRLVVEITEDSLLDENTDMLRRINELRSAGVQVALDDFGVGYSALSYLTKECFDLVKIDRSFVKSSITSDAALAVIEGVATMCRRLAIELVAEGVENPEQMEIVRQCGCRYMQGYHFSRPLARVAIDELVERSARQR